MAELQVIDGIADPAELALTRADVVLSNPELVDSQEEQQVLEELDAVSDTLGFSDKHYFIEANLSFYLSRDYDEDDPDISRWEDKFSFCGALKTYGIVKIGRLAVADYSVRALCLVFYQFSLLSTMETVEESDACMLCTPAYAVEDIAPGDWL